MVNNRQPLNTNKIILVILFILFSSPLFSAPYDMILTGDPVLEDLLYLSQESGNVLLSFTPPVAPAEVEMFLAKLDITKLQPPAREAYDRVKKRLTPAASTFYFGNYFSLSFNIASTIETQTKFNPDISWYPQYPKVPALISLPLRLNFADFIQIYMEPQISLDAKYYPTADFFDINADYDLAHLEGRWPLRAFITAGGAWWNFELGRDRLRYGTGHSGSLSISDNPPFYEFARISFFSEYVKYSFLLNQMPLEVPQDIYDKVNDAYHILNQDESDILKRSNERYYYVHRVDVNFRDILSIGLTEGMMVGNSGIELRFLNPLMIFHAFYSWWQYDFWTPLDSKYHMNGSFVSLEVNWNIIKSLSVYGQWCMNEFTTFMEQGDQPPSGMGFMGGINYSHSFTEWASTFFIEFAYTLPYAYMNPSPFASFIYYLDEQRYFVIGYPKDTITCVLGAKFFKGDTLSIDGEFSWTTQGHHAGAVWDWDRTEAARNETTPAGIAEHKFIASVEAQWKPLPYLTLKGSLSGIAAVNNGHKAGSDKIGGQASLSVSYTY